MIVYFLFGCERGYLGGSINYLTDCLLLRFQTCLATCTLFVWLLRGYLILVLWSFLRPAAWPSRSVLRADAPVVQCPIEVKSPVGVSGAQRSPALSNFWRSALSDARCSTSSCDRSAMGLHTSVSDQLILSRHGARRSGACPRWRSLSRAPVAPALCQLVCAYMHVHVLVLLCFIFFLF